MKKIVLCKDFDLKFEWYRSRLKNGPQYRYVLYFKGVRTKKYFYTKTNGKRFISDWVRRFNSSMEIIKESDPGKYRYCIDRIENLGLNL